MLSIHKVLSKLSLGKTQRNFDAKSWYPSAMYDENNICPKIETGYAFETHMIDISGKVFNNKAFIQRGNDRAIFENKNQSPANFKFQHLPINAKNENKEVKRMRNG